MKIYTDKYNRVMAFEEEACFYSLYTKKYNTVISIIYLNLDKTIGIISIPVMK